MSIDEVYCQVELICCSSKCVSIVLVVCFSVKGIFTVNGDAVSNFLSHKQYYLLTWWNMQRSCFFSSCPSLTSASSASIFVWRACSLYDIFSSSSATYNSNEREIMLCLLSLKAQMKLFSYTLALIALLPILSSNTSVIPHAQKLN